MPRHTNKKMTAAKVEAMLERAYSESEKLNPTRAVDLSNKIGENIIFVQKWFVARGKQTQLSRQTTPLPAPVPSPRTRSQHRQASAQPATPVQVRPASSQIRRSRAPSAPPQPSNSARFLTPAGPSRNSVLTATPVGPSRSRSPRRSSSSLRIVATRSRIFPAKSYNTLVRPLIEADKLPQMPRDLRNKMDADFEYGREDYSIKAGPFFYVKETIGGYEVVNGRWREVRNKVIIIMPQPFDCYPKTLVREFFVYRDFKFNLENELNYDDDEKIYRRIMMAKLKCGNCPHDLKTLRCINCDDGFCSSCVISLAINSKRGTSLKCPGCEHSGQYIMEQIVFPSM